MVGSEEGRRDGAVQPDLMVYYRPGCVFAARLRTKLTLARIPYRAVKFGRDSDADKAVRSVNDGNEISPTVRIGDRYLSNPTVHQVRQALSQP